MQQQKGLRSNLVIGGNSVGGARYCLWDKEDSNRAASRWWHAFALRELIVVLSVLTILLAVLLPALGNARSRRALCMSNVKQQLNAIYAYSQDNNDCMPFWFYPDVPSYNAGLAWITAAPQAICHWGGRGGWFWLYPSYIDDGHVFYCPSGEVQYEDASPYRNDPPISFAEIDKPPDQQVYPLTIQASYHLRGCMTPVVKNGRYDYYSEKRIPVRIPVVHPDWVIISDLGYQYHPTIDDLPLINHPDREGHPHYFSLGWADGHVTPYFVKNTDWTGFPEDCGFDDMGRPIFPLAGYTFWTAQGLNRMQEDSW